MPSVPFHIGGAYVSTMLLTKLQKLFYSPIYSRISSCLSTSKKPYKSLIFSLVFAFAVGLSAYNFGALARFKIPALPFYFIALIILMDRANLLEKVTDEAKEEKDDGIVIIKTSSPGQLISESI